MREIKEVQGISKQSYDRIGYYVDQFLFPQDIRGMKILDVGGADGTIGFYLKLNRGASVDIADEYEGHGASSSNYEKALAKVEELGFPYLKIIQGDIRCADLEPQSYEFIYLRNTLHHIFPRGKSSDAEVVDLFKRFGQWLVPGGSLIVGDCSWIMACRLVPPLKRRLFPDISFASKSSYRRWQKAGVRSGFSSHQLRWYVPYRLRRLRSILDNEIAASCLTGSYVLHLKKT